MIAVEIDGRPAISAGSLIGDDEVPAQLAKFETGRSYPYWRSVRDPREVRLEQQQRGLAHRVLLTAAFLLLMVAPGWLSGVR